MADRPDAYVRKDPGDIIRSGDWNELQIRAREEIRGHKHTGKEDGAQIPRTGIETHAINGNLIDPAADVTVNTLTTNTNLTVKGDLTINGKAILGDIQDLLAKIRGLDSDKINRTGDTINGVLTLKNDLQVGGKLAIGTPQAQAQARLHVVNTPQDASGNTLILGDTNSSNLRLGYNTEYSWIQSHGSKPLSINAIGNNVGIGITLPIAKLDIAQAARTGTHPTNVKGLYVSGDFGQESDGIEFRHSNGSQGIGFGWNTIYATGTNVDQDLGIKARGAGLVRVQGVLSVPSGIRVDGDRNTHIDTDGAFYRFQGQSYITVDDLLFIRKSDGTNSFLFNTINRTTTWSSDSRLKTDITPMTGMLEKVSALQGVFFKWKDSKSDDRQLGLLAQEVGEVFPELVSTDPDGMKGVNYIGFIAVLIEALKEQQNQIQQLFAAVK